MTVITFGEYSPDTSDYLTPNAAFLSNVVPRADGYGPVKALGSFTQPLAAGNDSSTKVLLHCDGTNTSTTFTDSNSGGSAHTWTAAGNAQISTAQYKFGGASGLFDGTGDWVSTLDHADFTLGSSDFTIDCWVRPAVDGSLLYIAGQADSTLDATLSAWVLRRTAGNKIEFLISNATAFTTITGATANIVAGAWYHVAVVRSGSATNNIKIYINGTLEIQGTFADTAKDSAKNLQLGSGGEVTTTPWNGWIDEFRLSNIARWTAAFTSPQKAYDIAANGVCRGEFYARNTDGTVSVFAATSTRLFELNNTSLDWIDVSKGGTAYSAIPSTDNWQYAQFGNVVMTVQANVNPQAFTLGSSSAFADLGGSPPAARYITVVGRIVVLTGLTSNPARVHNSDLDTTTTWSAGTGYANTVDLPDGGVVRGVAGGEFGLVFQESALRKLTFIPGQKPAFQIERVSDELGLLGPYSVIRASDKIFFYSSKGFMKYDGGAFVPIGKERVDRTIVAELDVGNLQLLLGSADPAGTRVFWGYKTLSNPTSTFDKMICYDYALDKWSPITQAGEYLAPLVKPGITLDGLDSSSPSIDAMGFSLDSVSSAVSTSLSGFNSSHQLGLFDGSNLEAIMETPEQALNDSQRVFIRGLRPITDANSIYCSIRHRPRPFDSLSSSSETAVNANGMCPQRVDTRYARGRTRIPAAVTWTFSRGIEPDFAPSGQR